MRGIDRSVRQAAFGASVGVSRRRFLQSAGVLPFLPGVAWSVAGHAPTPDFSKSELAPLRAKFHGTLLTPRSDEYTAARLVNNRFYDRYPALIARCADAVDVARALEFARRHGLPVAVRSGGHDQAGRCSVDGGVLLDLSGLQRIDVDAGAATVSLQSGVRVYQANDATVSQQLALPFGICGDVGVAGLTLGGGYGYISGTAGLACDSLESAEVVTADGQIRRVDDVGDADLMWALRGAGANFGVVTRMVVKAQRLDRVFGGNLRFAPAAAADVAALVNEIAPTLPDELAVFCNFITLPNGVAKPEISLCWSGAAEQGRAVVDRLIAARIAPSVDHLRSTTLAALVGRGEGTDGPSCIRYGRVRGQLPAAGLQVLLAADEPAPVIRSATLDVLHGAAARAPARGSAWPGYYAGAGVGYLAFWEERDEDAAAVAWAQTAWQRVLPFTEHAYVNMLGNESVERVRSAYGANLERLRRLKRKYDPDNVFRSNQNIPPATS